MGILGSLLPDIFGKIGDVVSEVVVDKDKKIELQVELQRLELELTDKAEQRIHDEMIAQVKVNENEANHKTIFVAGWRPAVGWVGVFSLAYSFIIQPFLEFGFQAKGPELQTEAILFLLSGMLGFGGLRTWEKIKGVIPEETSDLAGAKKPTSKPKVPQSIVVPPSPTLPENAPW